jgi:hypothetical protein
VIVRRVLGPDHPDTLATVNNLAGVLNDQGEHAEAEKMYRDVLQFSGGCWGPSTRAR